MDWREHIDRTPGVACGKPCFKGTRFAVDLVLEMLADGSTIDQIVAAHPDVLTPDRVRAAALFARDVVRGYRERPLPTPKEAELDDLFDHPDAQSFELDPIEATRG